MQTTYTPSEINSAINRSVSHNEIVTVAAIHGLESAYSQVSALADDCDYAEENNGDWDVWGTTDSGYDFRLRLSTSVVW